MARGFGSTKGSGTTDNVTLVYNSHSAPRTWSVWVKRNVTGTVFSKGATEGLSFTSGAWRFQRGFNTTSGVWTFTGGTGTASWIHLALVYDSSSTANDPTLYVDGVAQTTTRATAPVGTATTTSTAYKLGNNPTNTSVFDGEIGTFGIFSVSLSTSDIASLALGCLPLMVHNCVSSVTMGGAGVDEANTGSLTVTGTALTSHHRQVRRGTRRRSGFAPPQSIAVPAISASGAASALSGRLTVPAAALAGAGSAPAPLMGLTMGLGVILAAATAQAARLGLLVPVGALGASGAASALAALLSTAVSPLSASGAAPAPTLGLAVLPDEIAAAAVAAALAPRLSLPAEALAAAGAPLELLATSELRPEALLATAVANALDAPTRIVTPSALSAAATAPAIASQLQLDVVALAAQGALFTLELELAIALGILPATASLRPIAMGGPQVIAVGVLGSTATLLAVLPYYPPKHPTKVVLVVPAYRKVSLVGAAFRKVTVR